MSSAWDIATAFVNYKEGFAGKKAAAALKKFLLQHVDYTRLHAREGIKLSKETNIYIGTTGLLGHEVLYNPSILVHVVIPDVLQQDVRIFKNGILQIYRVERIDDVRINALLQGGVSILYNEIVRDAMSLFPPPTTVNSNSAKFGISMRSM